MSLPVLPRRAAMLLAALCGAPALAAPFAYIANGGSDTLSVIDTATNTVVTTLPVGDNPHGVGITKNNAFVYVTNFFSNSLTVIDAKTNTVATTIANVCTNPSFAEPAPNGTEMWVSCFNGGKVVIVDIATNTVVGEVTGQSRPLGITFNAAGTRAYVVSNSGSTMRIIDAQTRVQLTSVAIGFNSTDVQIDPAGTYAWVVANGDKRVRGIKLTNNQWEEGFDTGTGPVSLTFNPAGTRLYTTNISDGTLSVYNLQTHAVAVVNLNDGGPSGIDRNADGSRVYVAHEYGARVSVIDTATNTIVATIPVGTSSKSYGRFVAKGPPPADPPDPPTDVVATAQAGAVGVAFAAPANDGGAPVTGYTATCGTQSSTGTSTSLIVSNTPVGVPVSCTVVATNSAGTSLPSAPSNTVTPMGVPDAPTITSVVRGNGRVTVGYTLGANGGSPLQGVIINCGDVTVFGGNNPLPVAGLPNGVAVTCRMRARNGVGDGPWSADSAPVTPAGPPDAPTGVAATRGNGQVSVAFVAPANNGGVSVTGYSATCGTSSASGTASPIVVTNLVNGTPVTCTVTATNEVGTSAASIASSSVTPATVPDAPTGIVATPGNGQASVAFAAPADGGAAITHYVATCGTASANGTASPVVVTGLANGVAATCTVTATNDVGDGAASAASNSVTPATVPAAPTLATVASGDASAQLTFTAPADNGGAAIDGYRATCAPGAHTATGAASPLAVPGLMNGQTYTCSVAAQNAVGFGASSDGLAVVPRFVADIAVTIDNGVRFIRGGGETSYLIDVINGAARAVPGVRVRDVFGTQFTNVTWACAGQGGSTCPANGAGDIDVTVDLAANGSVSFLVDATVVALPEAPVSNTVAITVSNSVADPVSTNDTATDGPDAVGVFADGFE